MAAITVASGYPLEENLGSLKLLIYSCTSVGTGDTLNVGKMQVLGGWSNATGAIATSGNNTVFTEGTGYGNKVSQRGFDNFTNGAMEDKRVSAPGTQEATFTTGQFVNSATIVAAFKIQVSSTPKFFTLLGVGV